jgi:hypothetical protein
VIPARIPESGKEATQAGQFAAEGTCQELKNIKIEQA